MGFESYIKLWENELILVGCLHPLNVPAQLKSHLIGAKKVGVEENVISSVELTLSKL
jgi:alkylhydroperoxidase/carboxymuconolactone decarboxylase family protein YurZ